MGVGDSMPAKPTPVQLPSRGQPSPAPPLVTCEAKRTRGQGAASPVALVEKEWIKEREDESGADAAAASVHRRICGTPGCGLPMQHSGLCRGEAVHGGTRRSSAAFSAALAASMEPSPSPAEAPPTSSRPSLRSPRKKLFSIAFTWPSGAQWDAGVGRKSPSWYALCVAELISHYASDGASSFLVHVHGRPTHMVPSHTVHLPRGATC